MANARRPVASSSRHPMTSNGNAARNGRIVDMSEEEEEHGPAAKRRVLDAAARAGRRGNGINNANGNGHARGDLSEGGGRGNGDEDEEEDEEDGIEWTKEGFQSLGINRQSNDAVDFIRSMHTRLHEPIQRIQDSLDKYSKVAKVVEEAQEGHELIDKIQADLLEALEYQQILQIKADVLKSFEVALQRNETINGIEARFKEESEEKINKWMALSQRAKFKHDQVFSDFREDIWSIHHPGQACPPVSRWLDKGDGDDGDDDSDDEIEMGGATQDFKCPITLRPYENPVTNKACKHSYSRDAIMSMFAPRKPTFKCPVAGCTSVVTKDQLEVDYNLQRRAAEYQKRLARNRSEDDEEEAEMIE